MISIRSCLIRSISLNIWIFNHYAKSPDMPGSSRHYDFSTELVKRGHRVRIFASSFHSTLHKEMKEFHDEKYKMEDVNSVYFTWIKTKPYKKNNWKRALNMCSYSFIANRATHEIKEEKPDIVLGSSVHLFAVFVAYLVSRHFKVPFVMEVRDLWPQTLIDMGMSKLNPFIILMQRLEKFLYKKAKLIITLLPNAKEYIEGLNVQADKIMWLPNGVDLSRFKMDKTIKRNDSNFQVTYAGALSKGKNLDVLIDVAEKIAVDYKDIDFHIIGDGPERHRLQELIEQKNLNNVTIVGAVSKNKVFDCLREADVLFTSAKGIGCTKYGISPNKVFDYLAAGKPVVFARLSSNNPIEEAEAGFTVPPDDPEKIAVSIIRLHEMNEEERLKLGINGRKYVEDNYSIEKLTNRLEDVLKEACAQ